MEDKYVQLIETLAAKLGTTAEHLWGVLVRQAPITGAVDVVLCVVMVAALVWWTKVVIEKTRVQPNEYGSPMAEWGEEKTGCSWVSVVVAMIFIILVVCFSAQEVASAFFNPEYWALKQIIK